MLNSLKNTAQDESLRADVRLLGNLLGETIKNQHGQRLFDLVEKVRGVAKQARRGDLYKTRELISMLSELNSDELFNLARSFTMFLNLANIAEQHHQVRQRRLQAAAGVDKSDCNHSQQARSYLERELDRLLDLGISPDMLFEQVCKLNIELILTAHPTEVLRRSISSKYQRIARLLTQRDRADLSAVERFQVKQSLHRAITEVWETDEIRRLRPTPVDEAKTGLVAIEHSLWDVVPSIQRELDQAVSNTLDRRLPMDALPLRFGSWMGGDRDGNPNTTPIVTSQVCVLNRLKAAELFFKEIDELRRDLSMSRCNTALREEVGDEALEPYRALLERVLKKLKATVKYYTRQFEYYQSGQLPKSVKPKNPIYQYKEELHAPLMLCYESLVACGDSMIAEGRLTDILRRLNIFGLTIFKLDIRQEAIRHTEALDTITRYLDMGSYAEWDETARQEFLIRELQGNRPLITSRFPATDEASPEVIEVIETFRMIARENYKSFGAYVISMATAPSDVLAVALLQKECRVQHPMRVVPLFERLDALEGASACMDTLFSIPWYREYINGRQEVMIGYSDSAKDAGILSASWGLYQAQEEMVAVFSRHGIELTLFHGRGGTVARGGAPAAEAIRSQPPGSVNGTMRVTEQGEVIQAKYGLPGMAMETLQTYLSAVLEATLIPPPQPGDEWRMQMKQLSGDAVDEFHAVVRHNPDFVEYFKLATPEEEIGKLKIGSRPARRRKGSGIQYLRAIPWIFAWTQTRLLLPAWLGVGAALENSINKGQRDVLQDMARHWPFFRTTMGSIEMVFAKANVNISSIYDERLVPDALKALGEELRQKYHTTMNLLLEVTGHEIPLEDQPVVRQSVDIRNTYVVPLNLLQVELLARLREKEDDQVMDALLVTINGIAAGMRNTG